MQPAELERICPILTNLNLTSKRKVTELSSFENTNIDSYLSKWEAR